MQLKNMIAALHSSKDGCTKSFTINDVKFGWRVIEDMFNRETTRIEVGLPRRIPGLRANVIYIVAHTAGRFDDSKAGVSNGKKQELFISG